MSIICVPTQPAACPPPAGPRSYPGKALPPGLCPPPHPQASAPKDAWFEEDKDSTDTPSLKWLR